MRKPVFGTVAVSRAKRPALASAVAALALFCASAAYAGFEIKGANIPVAPKMSGGALESDSTLAPIGMTADAAGNPAIPVTAVPIDAPAPVDQAPAFVAAADANVVSGFGSDLPLVIALQQIAPPGYQFSFADDVEAGQRVSWQGGKPWRDVLTEMLATRGLAYDLRDDNVLVVMTESEAAAMPVQTAQVTPAKKQPVAAAETQAVRRQKPSTMIGRLRAQLTGDSGEAMRRPAAVSASQEWDEAEADVAAAAPASSVPVSSAAPAPAPVMATTLHADEEFARPPAAPVMPSAAEDLSPIALTAAPSARTSLPPSYAPAPYSAPAYVPATPAAFAMTSSMSAPQAARFQAPAGETLRSVLARWSAQSGVTLFWSIDYDYRLSAPVSFDGSFQQAAAGLLDGFVKAKPRPYAQLHQPANGGETLVVKAYGVN